jgi:hypothetical protein
MGSPTLARYDRPTPALGGYDVLLASDHRRGLVDQAAAPAGVGA